MTLPRTGLVCEALVLASPPNAVDPVPPLDVSYRPGSLTVLDANPRTTTLLWTLAGVVPPVSGTVTLDGVAVLDAAGAVAAGLHLVPEDYALLPSLTALENVLMPTLVSGRGVDLERASTALFALGLQEVGDHLVEELSGGQQQRVAIARALSADARAILLHEPTSALDAANRQRVLALLAGHAERGAVVILTSNDPDTIEHAPVDRGRGE